MEATIRLGKISSINYAAGKARVTYEDRDQSVTAELPFLAWQYNMPKVSDLVVVACFSNGSVSGVILVIALFGMPIIAKKGNLIREKSSLAMRIIAVVFTIYSVLLGFSRLYVGVHYPTDVLAGLALGLITSAIAYLVYQLILKKIANKKTRSSKE